ncbi:extracellular solute-binding protein [Sinorhizobium psoraleae]|uniref:extracellular solute-binding protein n=1 Tax=Sinorhizobium psoraleae TaxID=520838 RepID=UPI00289D4BB0|nr:extracellular solute-binding protein [Sinorhizobium psoraleae]
MAIFMNRRGFMHVASSAIAAGALSSSVSRASAQSNELRVVVNGGASGKAKIEAYVKPFEAETGIKVTAITDDFTLPQLELMTTTNNVSVDVVGIGANDLSTAVKKGQLEKIDYSIYKKDELDALVDFAKADFESAISFTHTIWFTIQINSCEQAAPHYMGRLLERR